MKSHTKQQFSLIELVVSLSILAVLGSIVLNNLGDNALRVRQQRTNELGCAIQNAIRADRESKDVPRFLSDMGRWPKVHSLEAGKRLAQLYDRSIWNHSSETSTMFSHSAALSVNAELCGVSGAEHYPTILQFVGWDGPYFLFRQQDEYHFYDGWKNEWQIVSGWFMNDRHEPQNTTPQKNISAGMEIDGIVSYGGDRMPGISDGAADVDQAFLFPHEDNLATLIITFEHDSEIIPQPNLMLFAPFRNETANKMELGYYLFRNGSTNDVELKNASGDIDADTKTGTSEYEKRMIAIPSWSVDSSQLVVRRLVPGHRQVWSIWQEAPGKIYTSSVKAVELRRGLNRITVKLR